MFIFSYTLYFRENVNIDSHNYQAWDPPKNRTECSLTRRGILSGRRD